MTRPSTLRFAVSTLVVLAVIAGSAGGCTPPDKQAGPREKITFAYTTAPDAVLVQIAFAKGFFAEEGLDATPQPHAFGKLALESVMEGKADLATVGHAIRVRRHERQEDHDVRDDPDLQQE